MSNRNFYINSGPYKLSEIAQNIGCEFTHSTAGDISISAIKSLSEAGVSDISFFSNKKYMDEFKKSQAGACLVPLDFTEESDIVLLKTANPYHAYAKMLDMFYSPGKLCINKIMPSAYVSRSAKIGKNCYIGHNVVIEDEAEIGDDCVIESGSIIDYKVKIGNRARIDSNVSISYSVIGNDVVVLPGARIGQDGFGFSTDKGIHKKIYHTGRVVIGNDVEIGANTCIDRGSMNDTIIEDLCRIDNLVQIGHNAHIKKGAILVSQVGIAGSSKIGSYCALGGQVGVAGHITIADGVQISGQGGVIQDIKEAGIMGGTPAVPIRDWHKQTIIMKNLIKGKRK
ncbi:MAG: UDP-3-O-(3-hydroxymyristoyl)glucosamine N-acyltransferase [Rickettsiaceae bacterium]|nr:UDP-3-O-(3-hydroxymyristoyl)glucosamine N-acyltransferase [Rickettsiaceae bacterium]MDP4832633.1 UDP-3-O-(3-hydroxymyristoyl)glucosamine N-acyltransferase [Rickettsiaceae bacterium]MDP5020927.1 UDP-3-O-(3-hydroxymyristoyl)glucosamine N-acyltransferase [Rickettsiaceae bacterium]MDP5083173.1 UDP-3-O-(3-hydroxymyristoyl)glucosamine N-acyltransferase [Rickettsiaceae bacterium]